MGTSSAGGDLSTCRGSAEMISNGSPYADGMALIKRVGEHLLPTAKAW
jgi:hypothetical protein